ncbi:MAG TPA: Sb-PDE family phosphodiesterase, partial [Phycisphaerae bacterium]|nr:Sb-PDE family phosphodiesterase [Phycisphaerae bacterium]
LFAGRTVAWYKNQLIGPENLLAPMLAACVEIRPPHHQNKDSAWVEIRNLCELDLTLELGPAGSITRANIPAGATNVVRLSVKALSADGSIACKASNFITAPNTVLQTRLMIATPKPAPTTSPAGI